MEMRYEPTSAATPSDTSALKATVEAMLIRERREPITKVTRMAFRGISHPGRTCSFFSLC